MEQEIITFKEMSFSKTHSTGHFVHILDKGVFLGSNKGSTFLVFSKELLVTYAYQWQFDEELSLKIPTDILADVFGDIHTSECFMEFGGYKFRQARLKKYQTFRSVIKKLFPLGLQNVQPKRFWRLLEKSTIHGLFGSAIRAAIYAGESWEQTAERFADRFAADKQTPFFEIKNNSSPDFINHFTTKEDYVCVAEVGKSKDLQRCFERCLELIPVPVLP